MSEWTDAMRARLAHLQFDPRREAEIVDELAQHLEDRRQELLETGVPRDRATALALAELDDEQLAVALAKLRQAHAPAIIAPGEPGRGLFADVRQDVRYAFRLL